jgi:hypothetical protein
VSLSPPQAVCQVSFPSPHAIPNVLQLPLLVSLPLLIELARKTPPEENKHKPLSCYCKLAVAPLTKRLRLPPTEQWDPGDNIYGTLNFDGLACYCDIPRPVQPTRRPYSRTSALPLSSHPVIASKASRADEMSASVNTACYDLLPAYSACKTWRLLTFELQKKN